MQMSLFGQKSDDTRGAVAPELSPTLSAADLTAASQLMDRWDAASGDNDAMWDCMEAIARLGGFRSAEATLELGYQMGDDYAAVRRPWRWWAEAARLANTQGEYALAGRIFLFAVFFTVSVLPNMDWVTQGDVGLSDLGGGIFEDIARSAMNSLSHLPSEMLIKNVANDQVDVASALGLARRISSSTDA
jgi:hypothetical protein